MRAIAVLAVISYHSLDHTGGFLGVDIFFVLSGFLITSLLLREHARTRAISLRHFYMRRCLRILPALFFLLACCITIAAVISIPRLAVIRDTWTALAFISNWAIALNETYVTYTVHLWSLAIEEQFYSVWPILLALILPRWRPAKVLQVVAFLALTVAAWRAACQFMGFEGVRIYPGFDTRADALLIGAAGAIFWAMPYSELKQACLARCRQLAPLGIVLLVWLVAGAGSSSPAMFFIGYFAFALACGGLLLLVAAREFPGLNAFLELPALQFVGRISYGLYLWHVLMLRVFEYHYGFERPMHAVIGLPIAFFGAWLSYRYIEAPALRLKARFATA